MHAAWTARTREPVQHAYLCLVRVRVRVRVWVRVRVMVS